MTQKMALKLHDTDNVAVCTSEVSAGDIVAVVALDGARTEVKATSSLNTAKPSGSAVKRWGIVNSRRNWRS